MGVRSVPQCTCTGEGRFQRCAERDRTPSAIAASVWRLRHAQTSSSLGRGKVRRRRPPEPTAASMCKEGARARAGTPCLLLTAARVSSITRHRAAVLRVMQGEARAARAGGSFLCRELLAAARCAADDDLPRQPSLRNEGDPRSSCRRTQGPRRSNHSPGPRHGASESRRK